jgi:hypothetical protein
MAKRLPPLRPDPSAAKIRDLEADLWRAHRALVDLMDEPHREVLNSYLHATDSLWRWRENAALRLVDLCRDVEQRTYGGYPLGAPRAVCPLCGGGSSAPYDKGFALPEGLMRHLLGTHNSRQCDIFFAAESMARSSSVWRSNKAARP